MTASSLPEHGSLLDQIPIERWARRAGISPTLVQKLQVGVNLPLGEPRSLPVRTLGQFVRLSEEQIKAIPGIGKSYLASFRHALAKDGLCFGMQAGPGDDYSKPYETIMQAPAPQAPSADKGGLQDALRDSRYELQAIEMFTALHKSLKLQDILMQPDIVGDHLLPPGAIYRVEADESFHTSSPKEAAFLISRTLQHALKIHGYGKDDPSFGTPVQLLPSTDAHALLYVSKAALESINGLDDRAHASLKAALDRNLEDNFQSRF